MVRDTQISLVHGNGRVPLTDKHIRDAKHTEILVVVRADEGVG